MKHQILNLQTLKPCATDELGATFCGPDSSHGGEGPIERDRVLLLGRRALDALGVNPRRLWDAVQHVLLTAGGGYASPDARQHMSSEELVEHQR